MSRRYEEEDWERDYGRRRGYGASDYERDRYRGERSGGFYRDRSNEYWQPRRSWGEIEGEYPRDYAREYDRSRRYGSRESYGNYDTRDDERNRFGADRSENRYSDRYPDVSRYRSSDSYSSRYKPGDDREWRSPNERGWWDRASDEVSSWFGDEEAERRRRLDHLREGEHRGRGPRGYKRSDDRIKEDVNDRLTDHPRVDASEIDVSVENGEVTLTGTVSSRNEKRIAEDVAEAVSGVTNVENRLRVSQSGQSWDRSSTTSSSDRLRSATSTGTNAATGDTALGMGAAGSGSSSTRGRS